ncbi:hypothetical protein [Sphingobacterium hungaricum]|uniref:Uncharacterized protein n=1 Tax=Sphingobacterium hungaricum TaxID=2082723 RepID=A0A928YRS0_9SPHI|nr:hypothetical protein [Sphingobacterium hungaricum]MBE8714972.1 hypothetical protein [Sphingobacterium hungaricum]
MITQKNRFSYMVLGIACLLLIPFAAMQFSTEVNWSLFDFMVMGALLFGTVLLIELVLRTVKTKKNRIALCIVLLLAFLFIWAELAVGIIGSPFAGS